MEFVLEYKVQQSKNGKFPSQYKLAQSYISPSKRAFEKYKPRGLFSEFYGMELQFWCSFRSKL